MSAFSAVRRARAVPLARDMPDAVRRYGPTALLALPAVVYLVLGWDRRWTSDDAFINYRVVDQVLAGNGPVFNEGERVEVYTSALWLALLAVGDAVVWFAEIEWIGVVAGLLLSAGGLLAGTFAAARLARENGATATALPLGALVVLAVSPFWDFATSGLETGLSFGWLGFTFWLLVRLHGEQELTEPPSERRFVLAALLVGLGPLVRPDLALFSIGFLIVLLVLRRPARRASLLKLVALAAALPFAYQVFRMGYFAALVPNTAFAKEAGRSWWDQGTGYLRDFVSPYYLALPVGLLLVAWNVELVRAVDRRRWRTALLIAAPVVCGAAHAVYIVRVGGDFMHGRLLLPSLFGALLPVAAVAPRSWRLYALPALVLVGWALVAGASLRPDPNVEIREGGELAATSPIVDERWWYSRAAGDEHPVELEAYAGYGWVREGGIFRELANSGQRAVGSDGFRMPWLPSQSAGYDVVAIHRNIGMFGFASGIDVRVVDRLGLADPIAGRLHLEARGRPGHEKFLPLPWAAARFVDPATLVAAPPLVPRLAPEQVSAAGQAMECGKLQRVLDAVEEPLTPGRFVRNIGVSVSTARFRVPGDPVLARDLLCG